MDFKSTDYYVILHAPVMSTMVPCQSEEEAIEYAKSVPGAEAIKMESSRTSLFLNPKKSEVKVIITPPETGVL